MAARGRGQAPPLRSILAGRCLPQQTSVGADAHGGPPLRATGQLRAGVGTRPYVQAPQNSLLETEPRKCRGGPCMRETAGRLLQREDHPAVDTTQEDHTEGQRGQLRDRKGPPDGGDAAAEGQKERRGQEDQELTDNRDHHAQQAIAQGLEGGGADDAEAREDKTQADDAQGGHTDGQHVGGRFKQAEDIRREELNDHQAHQHDGHGQEGAEFHRIHQAFTLTGTVVVGDDGHHAVVEAEHRHEHEALELEIHVEHGHGGGREGEQDLVHTEGHHRADGVENDGRRAHGVDVSDHRAVGAEAPEGWVDIVVAGEVEQHRQDGRHGLAQDGGCGSPRHLHAGEGAQAEDEHRVHDDVDDGPGALGDHGVEGAPGGLEQPFEHNFQEQPEGQAAADAHIGGAGGDDIGDIGLYSDEGVGQGEPGHRKDQRGEHRQKHAVFRRAVGGIIVLLPQAAGEEGVHTYAGAHAHGDQQILKREHHAHCRQGVLAELGHEIAVHHIVERLHQHGDHHRQRHGEHQPPDRHGAHFVFPQFF